MIKYIEEYPNYAFEKHKGYPTKLIWGNKGIWNLWYT